jgi:hypothetical protein
MQSGQLSMSSNRNMSRFSCRFAVVMHTHKLFHWIIWVAIGTQSLSLRSRNATYKTAFNVLLTLFVIFMPVYTDFVRYGGLIKLQRFHANDVLHCHADNKKLYHGYKTAPTLILAFHEVNRSQADRRRLTRILVPSRHSACSHIRKFAPNAHPETR